MLCLMMSFDLLMGFLFFDDGVDIHLSLADCDSLIFDLFLDVIDDPTGQ